MRRASPRSPDGAQGTSWGRRGARPSGPTASTSGRSRSPDPRGRRTASTRRTAPGGRCWTRCSWGGHQCRGRVPAGLLGRRDPGGGPNGGRRPGQAGGRPPGGRACPHRHRRRRSEFLACEGGAARGVQHQTAAGPDVLLLLERRRQRRLGGGGEGHRRHGGVPAPRRPHPRDRGLQQDEFDAAREDVGGTFRRTFDLVPKLGSACAGAGGERFRTASDLSGWFGRPYGAGWALVGDVARILGGSAPAVP